ncbi:MAG TPA: MFS transporter, partial [Candidatus Gracilibacteria bacterium]
VILLFAFALSNIGAALIEPLQEVYFFKEASKHHKEKLFGIYNSADPVANIIGPCIAGYLIIYGGLDWLWIGTAVILFLFFLLSFRIKD